jgi:hypothetical protein
VGEAGLGDARWAHNASSGVPCSRASLMALWSWIHREMQMGVPSTHRALPSTRKSSVLSSHRFRAASSAFCFSGSDDFVSSSREKLPFVRNVENRLPLMG